MLKEKKNISFLNCICKKKNRNKLVIKQNNWRRTYLSKMHIAGTENAVRKSHQRNVLVLEKKATS